MTTKPPWTPYDAEIEMGRGSEESLAAWRKRRAWLRDHKEGYLRALADLAPVIEAARLIADDYPHTRGQHLGQLRTALATLDKRGEAP